MTEKFSTQAPDSRMIQITEHISVQLEELEFTASHSSGPGGQNVNKLSTKVMLRYDLANSPALSEEQRSLVMRRLRTRVGKDGVLRVIVQKTRSQALNRELAVERFVELMREALRPTPIRRKTRVSHAARLRRLEHKKQQSAQKQQRAKKIHLED